MREGDFHENSLVTISVFYKTSHMREVYLKSLRSVLNFPYQPHDVIIVLNNPPDDTEDMIKEEIKSVRGKKSVHVIKLRKNLGYPRAVSIGYEYAKRYGRPKFVAPVNDDYEVFPSAVTLIKVLEKGRYAGASGITLTWDGGFHDHGFWYDLTKSLWFEVPVEFGDVKNFFRRAHLPTYLSGAFSIYKFKDLEECGGLFKPIFFLFGDDHELGPRLWGCGKRLISLPIIVGRHYGGGATRKGKKFVNLDYLSYLYYANGCVTNKMYQHPSLVPLSILKSLFQIVLGIKDEESLYAGVQRLRGILQCNFQHAKAPRFLERRAYGWEKGLYAIARILRWMMK